jgi:hypothetical protein
VKYFFIGRVCLAILIVCGTSFWLVIGYDNGSFQKEYDVNYDSLALRLPGDYKGNIYIKADTGVDIVESIRFTKANLDSIMSGLKFFLAYQKLVTLSPQSAYPGKGREFALYIRPLLIANWKGSDTSSGGEFAFTRERHFPIEKMGIFRKCQIFPVPFLLTDLSSDSSTLPKLAQNVEFQKNFPFSYGLSEKSSLKLYAKKGLVMETYPNSKGEDMLDSNDTQLFRFSKAELDRLVDDRGKATAIKVKLMNSLYANPVGEMIRDWSVLKVIGWALGALIALFADKIREKVLKPLVDGLPFWNKKDQVKVAQASKVSAGAKSKQHGKHKK